MACLNKRNAISWPDKYAHSVLWEWLNINFLPAWHAHGLSNVVYRFILNFERRLQIAQSPCESDAKGCLNSFYSSNAPMGDGNLRTGMPSRQRWSSFRWWQKCICQKSWGVVVLFKVFHVRYAVLIKYSNSGAVERRVCKMTSRIPCRHRTIIITFVGATEVRAARSSRIRVSRVTL